MSYIYYLAYGSNLHPLRMGARVPSARPVGVVEIPGFLLAFHKRSFDGSGKCLLYDNRNKNHQAFGVLYEFEPQDKTALDRAEGRGNGYCEQLVPCSLNGKSFTPYLYAARSTHVDPDLVPYHWYKELVLAGARYHGFPDDYIASIENTASMPDPDKQRTQENGYLLERMRND